MIYDLYAVLIHVGHECWSGHYYCYVKNSNNTWYQVKLLFFYFFEFLKI